jgi:hypothetical protein
VEMADGVDGAVVVGGMAVVVARRTVVEVLGILPSEGRG